MNETTPFLKWECLAVLSDIHECRTYIYESHLTKVTDNSSFKWLINITDPEQRLACRALKLQSYDYAIVYCPGTKHANADCLSRLPMVALIAAEDKTIFGLILSPHKWRMNQRKFKNWVQK